MGAKGHIPKIRRERVEVHFPDQGFITVSAQMLRRIEPPSGGCKGHEEVDKPGAS